MEFSKEDLTIRDWDAAECIDTKELALEYLKVVIADNDPEFLLEAIADVAHSEGGMALARELKLDREGLFQSLTTVVTVLDTLGFQLNIIQKKAS